MCDRHAYKVTIFTLTNLCQILARAVDVIDVTLSIVTAALVNEKFQRLPKI